MTKFDGKLAAAWILFAEGWVFGRWFPLWVTAVYVGAFLAVATGIKIGRSRR